MIDFSNIKRIACIGSRRTPEDVLLKMRAMGHWLANHSIEVSTGACRGADQSFAQGALDSKQPSFLTMYLPWSTYEKDFVDKAWDKGAKIIDLGTKQEDPEAYDSVYEYHPNPHALSQGALKLHARNHLILDGSDLVICWTPNNLITGGTGQAMREAEDMGIPIVNLSSKTHVIELAKSIELFEEREIVL